jgi:hypothetical protein
VVGTALGTALGVTTGKVSTGLGAADGATLCGIFSRFPTSAVVCEAGESRAR